MDGQGLQTLYCNPAKYDPTSNSELASINSIAWSTDQKLVMFTEGNNSNNPLSLYLLNLAKGTVQEELQPDPNSSISYSPRVWVDNTHVALFASDSSGRSQEESIYILNTNNGANQRSSNLRLIVTAPTSCFGFDIGSVHTAFFLYRCTPNSSYVGNPGSTSKTSLQGPSSISMLPVTGGAEHTIFSTQTLPVESIGVISNTSLLVIVGAGLANSQNGLYTMHTDGTGFTKLIGYDVLGIDLRGFVFEFHQFSPWSIVSRDGHMYAVGLIHSCGLACSYSLLVGSLSGGNITNVASGLNTSIAIVGWTTM